MASIRKEIIIDADSSAVWDAVRDVGAAHRRLTPGVLVDCRMDGDARVVTFANGMILRELIVDIDDAAKRLVYSSVGSRATHHNAAMQVFTEGPGTSRIVWQVDILPNEVAVGVTALMEQGAQAMQRALAKVPA